MARRRDTSGVDRVLSSHQRAPVTPALTEELIEELDGVDGVDDSGGVDSGGGTCTVNLGTLDEASRAFSQRRRLSSVHD
jgi:hypothetical protein